MQVRIKLLLEDHKQSKLLGWNVPVVELDALGKTRIRRVRSRCWILENGSVWEMDWKLLNDSNNKSLPAELVSCREEPQLSLRGLA